MVRGRPRSRLNVTPTTARQWTAGGMRTVMRHKTLIALLAVVLALAVGAAYPSLWLVLGLVFLGLAVLALPLSVIWVSVTYGVLAEHQAVQAPATTVSDYLARHRLSRLLVPRPLLTAWLRRTTEERDSLIRDYEDEYAGLIRELRAAGHQPEVSAALTGGGEGSIPRGWELDLRCARCGQKRKRRMLGVVGSYKLSPEVACTGHS